jgi:hypothetical protein
MKTILALAALTIIAGAATASERSANAYKATRVSTTSVLVSCQDEREPHITKLENTTAIVVTCKLEK